MTDLKSVQFGVLYDSLSGYHQGFIDSAFRVTGFLLLVLGWLLTSKEAREYLGRDETARRLVSAGLTMAAAIYAFISYRVYLLSQQVFARLHLLAYVPGSTYEDHLLHPVTLVAFISANLLLTACAVFFVMRLRDADVSGRQER
jgi:hypothetical protein